MPPQLIHANCRVSFWSNGKLNMKKWPFGSSKAGDTEISDSDAFELADDTLAQRLCVLAQTELMNRKRDKAHKTITDAAGLAQGEDLKKEIADVTNRINAKH